MQDAKKWPKIAIWAPSHNFVGLYLWNQGMYQQSEKNLLNSNTSSTCPDNIVHFGLLTAEIHTVVWGTPANFNGLRVLAALLHGSGRQPNFAALNRGRHLCSAGRPCIRLGIGPHSSFNFLSPSETQLTTHLFTLRRKSQEKWYASRHVRLNV